jgi:hypothetical protein
MTILLYVTGYTDGNLFHVNKGSYDFFIAQFNSDDGNIMWGIQNGSTVADVGSAVWVDESGNLYVAGSTDGVLFGASQGTSDAFLVCNPMTCDAGQFSADYITTCLDCPEDYYSGYASDSCIKCDRG